MSTVRDVRQGSSGDLAYLMQRGWRMLSRTCPTPKCYTPLVQNRESNHVFCVSCDRFCIHEGLLVDGKVPNDLASCFPKVSPLAALRKQEQQQQQKQKQKSITSTTKPAVPYAEPAADDDVDEEGEIDEQYRLRKQDKNGLLRIQDSAAAVSLIDSLRTTSRRGSGSGVATSLATPEQEKPAPSSAQRNEERILDEVDGAQVDAYMERLNASSAAMGPYLLKGYCMLEEACAKCHCPLMMPPKSQQGNPLCVVCKQEQKTAPPAPEPAQAAADAAKPDRTDALDAKEAAERTERGIKRSGELMLSGYTMCAEACPTCCVALMQKSPRDMMFCPACDQRYVTPDHPSAPELMRAQAERKQANDETKEADIDDKEAESEGKASDFDVAAESEYVWEQRQAARRTRRQFGTPVSRTPLDPEPSARSARKKRASDSRRFLLDPELSTGEDAVKKPRISYLQRRHRSENAHPDGPQRKRRDLDSPTHHREEQANDGHHARSVGSGALLHELSSSGRDQTGSKPSKFHFRSRLNAEAGDVSDTSTVHSQSFTVDEQPDPTRFEAPAEMMARIQPEGERKAGPPASPSLTSPSLIPKSPSENTVGSLRSTLCKRLDQMNAELSKPHADVGAVCTQIQQLAGALAAVEKLAGSLQSLAVSRK